MLLAKIMTLTSSSSMATFPSHIKLSPILIQLKNPRSFAFSNKLLLSKNLFSYTKFNGYSWNSRNHSKANFSSNISSTSSSSTEIEKTDSNESGNEKLSFDINLAVILAGFAFEAYTTPPEKAGKREVDAANCQIVFLSESFVREIYDGQLFIKLKKGFNFPAMDPWGTSDPYVVLELDSQQVKSNVKWGTKEPTWNEEFTLNIKLPPMHILQVAAWDANLFTPHKRMGNAGIDLENLCDGMSHEVVLDLEGMGGGGKVELEIKYKSIEKIDDEKKWWKIPIVTEFLQKTGLEPALKMISGSETVQAREFVQFAFGKLKSINETYLQNDWFSNTKTLNDPTIKSEHQLVDTNKEDTRNETNQEHHIDGLDSKADDNGMDNMRNSSSLESKDCEEESSSDEQFWKKLADSVNKNIFQKLGLPEPESIKWDGFDLLETIGLQSREIAEAGYVESGLAAPDVLDNEEPKRVAENEAQTSLPDIKKVTQEILRQTDSILGAIMVLNAAVSKLNKTDSSEDTSSSEANNEVSGDEESETSVHQQNGIILGEKEAEEMRALFSTAESAMEAWAMLANALGHPTFIKSEFEKICFLDNTSTDTEVAIWRDRGRKRLVVAFRGTEQSKWKDLDRLDASSCRLNPERIGGDFKEEVQVHSGFLGAYDSVRPRLIALIKQAIGHRDDSDEELPKWQIYVTGHSLGGALATLLALELSSSQLSKRGAISVTMYNFGSPRVGNRRFAEVYNEKVKDSWRVVNHRDIIPTVPRLMGYCHVAHPVYLGARDLRKTTDDVDVLEGGYQGDVIGEATPDVLVSEFMRGEKELVEKILNTEINIFRSIRDGSALMQHMEDFYYITLLETVRSSYQTLGGSQPANQQLSA